MKTVSYRQLVRLTAALLVCLCWNCGDSGDDGDGDPPCTFDDYMRDHYLECTTEGEREAIEDDVRQQVERLNLDARRPGYEEMLNCDSVCTSADQTDCTRAVHACSATDATPDEATCVWRVQYWTGERYSDDPGGPQSSEPTRMPFALCDCDMDLEQTDPWCQGEVPEDV